jgi:hypothetical protein
MPTLFDIRQSVLRTALNMAGTAAGASVDSILLATDPLIAKLYQDRNAILTDGGTVTFTGTQVQFSETLNLNLEQQIGTAATPTVISLGSASQTFTLSGDILYAIVNRNAGTATLAIASPNAGSPTFVPAASSTNQDIFVIAIRKDALDGTQRLYFRNGFSMNAGQTLRVGQGGGSGSGSGTGDDLDALLFRASFTDTFTENDTNANSSILASGTNATFSAAKAIYTMLYDASKTVTGTGTAMTFSSAPSFTVAVGDVVIIGSTVLKITAVASQTSVTIEASWPSDPTATACTISQAVYTKDIYNAAIDGAAIATSFPGTTFSEILVDYKDNAVTNSNLWTPDVTPLVAFTATNDGTNFTAKQVRTTNTTDIIGSTLLPSAGSGLSLRFFANPTSGTGFVNLITYKAFMQKSASSTSGGVTNSAYAFTNGVGTPINASVSTAGGKTSVTLNWAYAVGVLPGTTASSIEVWINGSKIPRFVNSTLTPDASFVETSSNVITLDKDYSSLNLSVEVFQRTQIVDASTTNTTSIASLQEISQNGFQSFVSQTTLMNPTSTSGTPASGSFYSTIVNRAPIVDLSRDLKAHMGLERLPVQSLTLLQSEFGPNGELIWISPNDSMGQVRFGGNWTSVVGTTGQYASATNPGDFIEVTFFGTGLNIIDAPVVAGVYSDLTVTVDGVSSTTLSNAATLSTLLNTRNYNANRIRNVVTGLSNGVHTVKMTLASAATNGQFVYGFEVLTSSSSIITSMGTSYNSGKKLSSVTQSSIAYNTAVTGIRGGRVLQYQKADGTIGQSFQPTNSTAAFLASADHTNEEIVRTTYFREFGAGRADDFSGTIISGVNRTAAFTLDDGTTTLTANALSVTSTSGTETVRTDGGSNLTFTFIGTGLDIVFDSGATVRLTAVSVDGSSVGSVSLTTINQLNTKKIASGLPYGTHTVKLVSDVTNGGLGIARFITYQPKKPTLPAGATELADYNVLANYVFNSTAVSGTAAVGLASTGVMRKLASRELLYIGSTWTSGGLDTANFNSGINFNAQASSSFYTYTFFGTGVELRTVFGASLAVNVLISIDGSSNLTPYTTASSLVTGVTFVASTGTISGTSPATTSGGNAVSITNLPLGLHTVSFRSGNANAFYADAIDIITPIHSAKSNLYQDLQNALPVGSQGISDNRKITPLKDQPASIKASAQVIGITAGPSSSSTTAVPINDLSATIKLANAARVRVSYAVAVNTSALGATVTTQIYVDGVPVGTPKYYNQASNASGENSDIFSVYLSAGTHKVDAYWFVSSASVTSSGIDRTLLVEEA